MENLKSDFSVSRHWKLSKGLLILLSILILVFFISISLRRVVSIFPAFLIWFFILIDVLIIVILSRKFYNWNLFFLLIIVTSLYLRSQRLPPWPQLLSLGFTGLSCVSLYSSYFFLKKFNHNIFLKYIGFASSIILSIVCLGILWKSMHWPLAGVMSIVGQIVFIPFLFAFVIILPSSNYVNWTKTDRIVFFRTVIIPMIFVYILCVFMFVLGDIWASISRAPIFPFGMGMEGVDLFQKPGL